MHKPLVYSTSALIAASLGFGATKASAQDAEPQVINAFEDESLPEGQGVEVGTTGEISITVVDLDVTKVLQLLSMQSQRNIVASKNVTGELSASLTDVDFYEALDAILVPNGFGYQERGSFIYVYTADELAEMEEATRVPIYEVLTLNYISAADAAAFVSPLLSERGVVTVSAEVVAGIDPSTGDAGANTFAHQDTLMVRDYEENVAEIKAVLEHLDTRPKQVKIEATILEAKLTDENRFGIDFALFTNLDFNQFFGPFAALGSAAAGNSVGDQLQSTAGIGADAGGVKVGVTGKQGALLVSALDSITDTTLLANPQILVLNRQRAKLLVGEKLGYVTTTRTDVSDSETVEFLEVGTSLNVRPFVSDDDYVRMELEPSVSDGSTEETSTGSIIPNESTETLTTNVIVKSGQTVVLGGLFKEDTEVGRRQIPWAGDVPVLGLLGSNRNTKSERSEVIFMIRPTIMKDQALFDAGDRAMEMTQKVRVGSREALLPFSRSAMVQGHLKNAYEALDAGDTEKAMWYVDLALYINPILPEAIELREQLTGQKTFYQSHSILESLVEEQVTEEIGAAPKAPTQAIEDQEAEDLTADLTSTDSSTVTASEAIEQATPEPAAEAGQAQAIEAAAETDTPQASEEPQQFEAPEEAEAEVEALEDAEPEAEAPVEAPETQVVEEVAEETHEELKEREAGNHADTEEETEVSDTETEQELPAEETTETNSSEDA